MKDSILNIVAPWINKEKEVQQSDREKFLELLVILDPKKMNLWFSDLYTGTYLIEKNIIIDKYFEFTRLPNTLFNRRKLTKAYDEFTKSFRSLNNFLVTYFFINENTREFYQLNPNLKSDNYSLYSQKLSELEALISDTQKKYNKLVTVGGEMYVGIVTTIISLLLLATVVTPGILYLMEEFKLIR